MRAMSCMRRPSAIGSSRSKVSARAEEVVEALSAGADDSVLHPFSAHQVLARIHAIVWRADRQREQRERIPASGNSQETLIAFTRYSQPGVVS